jgi:hypothetical protein
MVKVESTMVKVETAVKIASVQNRTEPQIVPHPPRQEYRENVQNLGSCQPSVRGESTGHRAGKARSSGLR